MPPTASATPNGLILLTVTAAVLLGAPDSVFGQSAGESVVRAVLPSLGEVLAVTPLQPGAREPGGDLNVHGTVSVRHNGPHRLQVRLSEPHTSPGPGGSRVTHDVFARVDDALLLLDTESWVTVATGAGSPGLVHPVLYLVAWGSGTRRRPADALDLSLVYQVVPLEGDGSP